MTSSGSVQSVGALILRRPSPIAPDRGSARRHQLAMTRVRTGSARSYRSGFSRSVHSATATVGQLDRKMHVARPAHRESGASLWVWRETVDSQLFLATPEPLPPWTKELSTTSGARRS